MARSSVLNKSADQAQKSLNLFLKSASRLKPLVSIDGMDELALEPYDALTTEFVASLELVKIHSASTSD